MPTSPFTWPAEARDIASATATRLLPCGPTSVMIEVDDTEQAAQLAAHLRSAGLVGMIDLVPAARTVLVTCSSAHALAEVATIAVGFVPDERPPMGGIVVEVPTVYDGDDLGSVAETTGMTVAGLIDLHSSTEYRAAFCGFVPGFAYLTGLPEILCLPRRQNPRPRVPGGSVAIGAAFTGVYPTTSPGGWHLLGRATVAMWDSSRPRPAFIEPGDTVRFVPVPGSGTR